jgi:hypothetical protein
MQAMDRQAERECERVRENTLSMSLITACSENSLSLQCLAGWLAMSSSSSIASNSVVLERANS